MKQAEKPVFAHLDRLTQHNGLVEHARLAEPNVETGCCTDDAGRLLSVLSPLGGASGTEHLCSVALRFLENAYDGHGGFRLRRRGDGAWTDDPPSDDANGRALQGLGVAAARSPRREVRARAQRLFDAAGEFRSTHLRATSHAALGAVAILEFDHRHVGARRLAADAEEVLSARRGTARWPWPESRLTYGNALIPEARLALAHQRCDDVAVAGALKTLEWLVGQESSNGHFSFTPVGGRGQRAVKPGFDQQPIEAWAMADACARAFTITGDERWSQRVGMAAAWFHGDNDVGVPVADYVTGAGFDGLERSGVNQNQGAESTLAFLATTLDLLTVTPVAAASQYGPDRVRGRNP